MYKSTKEYVKRRIVNLAEQCGISIDDIQTVLDELKEESYGDDQGNLEL